MRKLPSGLITGALVAFFFAVALYFRAVVPYSSVFTDAGIKFSSVDAYWHMRIIDNLLQNFPHLMTFDPYTIFPGGESLDNLHFFDWLLAGVIKVLSFGSPSPTFIDTVSAYFPAVLGAAVTIPVFFIGRALAGRWAGVIAAGLVSILPGEFLGRSIIGFTDHHVAESLFTAVALMFLILAVKSGQERNVSLEHVRKMDWKVLRRPLIFAVLGGLSLAIYMLTWMGSPLFVFLIAVYFVFQFTIDYLRGRSVDYLWIAGLPLFFIALLIILPSSSIVYYNLSLTLGIFIIAGLGILAWFLTSKKLSKGFYPLVVLAGIILGTVGFYLISPALFGQVLGEFSLFSPAGPQGQTTLEMQGMLFPSGNFSWDIALGNYNILFFVAPLMIIGLLIYIFINKDTPQQNLVLIWSIIMLAATLGQRRFGYYLAVNMAILGGYAIWWSLRALEPKNIMPASKAATAPGKTVRRVKNKPLAQSPVRAVFMALCGLVVIIMALLYDIPASASIATQTRFAPTDAWSSAMAWMKDNTPEPLGSKDAYYQNIPPTYQFPASAYGVTSWWDYGYWITRMAHRIPTANPGQSAVPIRNVARLYLSQNETAASEVMSSLKSSYVVLDFKTATSIFWAIAVWGGHDQSEYTDVYYTSDKQDGRLGPVMVYYPEYYRTLVSRLYNFDGKAVIVEKPLVVTYKEVNTLEKAIVKQVVEARSFNTYIDAQAYMAGLKGVKARIVSNDPFVSPVALEELKTFKKVYSSPQESTTAVGQVPEVKIFQFVK